MNNQTINQPDTNPIQSWIDSVIGHQPDGEQVDRAQRNLIARLDAETTPSGGTRSKLGWAAAAAVTAAVLLPMLLWMPGPKSALAFADVQQHFIAFDTLVAKLTTRMNEEQIVEMTIRVDNQDRTRLDAGGGFSYVIDPNQLMMLQLFHDQKRAMLVPLSKPNIFNDDTGLDWLADIRDFQGEAELLDQTRDIDGTQAQGFKLTAGGMDMTLWAAESGEPLRLQMAGPGGIETRVDFEFDQPLDEALFSLTPPASYQVLGEPGSDTPHE